MFASGFIVVISLLVVVPCPLVLADVDCVGSSVVVRCNVVDETSDVAGDVVRSNGVDE